MCFWQCCWNILEILLLELSPGVLEPDLKNKEDTRGCMFAPNWSVGEASGLEGVSTAILHESTTEKSEGVDP